MSVGLLKYSSWGHDGDGRMPFGRALPESGLALLMPVTILA